MATDKYTKTVLTIIAACLIILTFKEVAVIPSQIGATKITLCDEFGISCGLYLYLASP